MPVVYLPETGEITYQSLKEEVIQQKSDELLAQFDKYCEQHHLTASDVCIQKTIIPLIMARVDMREGYFIIYHKKTKINEIKQAALVAYWILKFRPFMIATDDPDRSHEFRRINEGFAAFYLLSAITQYAIEQGNASATSAKFADPSWRLGDEIMYAFQYWDLSKEAVILIAETIGEAFYGIKAQGLEDEA